MSLARYNASEVEFFWSLVDKSQGFNGCWIWKGYQRGNGYGRFVDDMGVVHYAHKYAFFQGRGREPINRILRSTCNNHACVNPNHYEARGFVKGGTKFSVDKIRQVRYTYNNLKNDLIELGNAYGVDLSRVSLVKAIADKFGASRQTIYDIVNNIRYKNI